MGDLAGQEKRIAQWIPSFATYQAAEQRRASDEAFRKYLIERIEHFSRCSTVLVLECDPARSDAAIGRGLAALGEELLNLADSLRSAPYVYGEFMTTPRIEDSALAMFYSRDESILQRAHSIQSHIEPTLSDATDLPALVEHLMEETRTLVNLTRERQEAISNFTLPPVNRG